ncbi:unnamed protein product, partial [Discosporangium mesarthrocarpum]
MAGHITAVGSRAHRVPWGGCSGRSPSRRDGGSGGGPRGGGDCNGEEELTDDEDAPSTKPQPPQLTLQLGLTDYRDFRGTNWSPDSARIAADGARQRSDCGAYLSNKLGVTALVETADGFFLALRRSGAVSEGQGMVGAPGGHPEPENIGLTPSVLKGLVAKDGSGGGGGPRGKRRRLEELSVAELFDSARQEAVDETNVPLHALSDPLMLGIARQTNSCGAPTA